MDSEASRLWSEKRTSGDVRLHQNLFHVTHVLFKESFVTTFALLLSIIISSASLAWGFAERGLTSLAVWALILGAGWLLAARQRWEWYSSIALVISVVAAALGLWIRLSPGWMFSGGLFALFAWDMDDFRRRLLLMIKDDSTARMVHRHITRASLLALAGMSFASITMLVRGQFTVEWAALLVLIVLLGLAQLAGWFRKF